MAQVQTTSCEDGQLLSKPRQLDQARIYWHHAEQWWTGSQALYTSRPALGVSRVRAAFVQSQSTACLPAIPQLGGHELLEVRRAPSKNTGLSGQTMSELGSL